MEHLMEQIFEFFSFLGNEVALFIIAMTPLLELRGSIPFGAIQEMHWLKVFLISIVGNMLPVPFIIFFGRKIIGWLKRSKLFSKIAHKIESKLMLKSEKVVKYETFGLCIFVAIPLPGTGAWSGAAIAALLDMRMSRALPSIGLGVVLAGIAVTILTYLVVGAVNLLQVVV